MPQNIKACKTRVDVLVSTRVEAKHKGPWVWSALKRKDVDSSASVSVIFDETRIRTPHHRKTAQARNGCVC